MFLMCFTYFLLPQTKSFDVFNVLLFFFGIDPPNKYSPFLVSCHFAQTWHIVFLFLRRDQNIFLHLLEKKSRNII